MGIVTLQFGGNCTVIICSVVKIAQKALVQKGLKGTKHAHAHYVEQKKNREQSKLNCFIFLTGGS